VMVGEGVMLGVRVFVGVKLGVNDGVGELVAEGVIVSVGVNVGVRVGVGVEKMWSSSTAPEPNPAANNTIPMRRNRYQRFIGMIFDVERISCKCTQVHIGAARIQEKLTDLVGCVLVCPQCEPPRSKLMMMEIPPAMTVRSP